MQLKGTQSNSISRICGREVLDLDTLRPGDIILSRQDTWESFWIAFFGLSRFSHASLVVSDEVLGKAEGELWRSSPDQPYTTLLEATTDSLPGTGEIVGGIGYWRLPRTTIRIVGSSSLPKGRMCPLERYAYFEVFRHQDSASEKFQAFVQHSIPNSCTHYLNAPYARLIDLAKVSFAPWFVNLVGKLFIDFPESHRRGLFCSQLVASIYFDGGFPLSTNQPALMRPKDIGDAPVLVRITPTTRRVLQPNEELFNPIEGLFPTSDLDADFRGRLTAWRSRDESGSAIQLAEKMTSVLQVTLEKTCEILAKEQRRADNTTDRAGH